jgi:glycosyltransferase involved in cell wall biosynthesis
MNTFPEVSTEELLAKGIKSAFWRQFLDSSHCEIINLSFELTVGIAVRNEVNTIQRTLSSIKASIDYARLFLPKLDWEILVCTNGCEDDSEIVIAGFIEEHPNAQISHISSEAGLVHAQRRIVRARTKRGYIMFFDADIVVEQPCVYELLIALESSPECQAVYAVGVPIESKPAGLIARLLILRVTRSELFTKRNFLHGRAFIIREWNIPEGHHSFELSNAPDFLQIKAGVIVDDIYLSRAIVHAYGLSAVQQCRRAKFRYHPITILRDFYLARRRTYLELRRLDLMFPEHQDTQKKYFRRRVQWLNVFRLSGLESFQFVLYRLLFYGVEFLVRLEMVTMRLGLISSLPEIFSYHASSKRV